MKVVPAASLLSVVYRLLLPQVPIDANQASMQFPSGKLVIGIAASVYTERMGHIRLSCEGGCTCPTTVYNLLHPFYRCASVVCCASLNLEHSIPILGKST